MLRSIYKILILLALTGCSNAVEIGGSNFISGTVKPLANGSSKATKSIGTLSCSSPTIHLFKVDNNGVKIEPELASSSIASDGTYTLLISGETLDINNDSLDYVLEVQGCAQRLSRLVTDRSAQDISYGSSLLSYAVDSSYSSIFSDTNHESLKQLTEQLAASSDIASAYSLIAASTERQQMFLDLFGVAYTGLLEIQPRLLTYSVPKVWNEQTAQNIIAALAHWSPSYTIAVEWKENGTTLSTNANGSWTPSANHQGTRTITLFYGKDDGGGNLDLTKPFASKNFVVTVNDTTPVQAPALALVTSTPNQSTAVDLSMTTGAALANCTTFSNLAITQDGLPPQPSDFTITCSTSGTQPLPTFNLSTGDGTRVLSLWAKDSADNISAPVSINYTLDTAAPVISSAIINGGAAYAGTTLTNVQATITDSVTPQASLQVRLIAANTSNGDCQGEYADDNWVSYTNSSTNIPFLITPIDGIKKVCVWAKDQAGNVNTITPGVGADGVDTDSINFQVGNPPTVTNFSVTRDLGGSIASPGDAMTINWTATDAESLDNNPVSISYTTDNTTWLDIISNADISNTANINWLGGLSGNPTSGTGTITTWTAPTSAYFRLKIISRDISGNTSLEISSNTFNTGTWSLYAGSASRGVGGSALSASFHGVTPSKAFAINPVTGDIYTTDHTDGIRKVSASTGLVSTVISHGTNNLPDNGPLPANPSFSVNYSSLTFDNAGRLYVNQGGHTGMKIYQIDFNTNHVRHYAGGGSDNDAGSLSTDLYLSNVYTFDESNSMYSIALCATHASPYQQGKRLLKIAQNPDGTPGSVTRIIGDCTFAAPNYGATAYSSPMGTTTLPQYGSITAWDNGDKIYFEAYPNIRWKIISGNVYSVTTVNTCGAAGSVTYNPSDGYLYQANANCGVSRYLPNTVGNGGEVEEILSAGNSTTSGCTNDNILASNACMTAYGPMSVFGGQTFFSDGHKTNAASLFRIRYIGADNTIRTIAGSLPFLGNGLNKTVVRGNFSGIHYKTSAEPNQAAFPEGLYFNDSTAMVFGRIDPSGIASVLWGNQSRQSGGYTDNDTVSKDLSYGAPYSGGNGMPLSFDNTGLPWLRAGNNLFRIDASKQLEQKTTGTAYWHDLADGADPTTTSMYVYSLSNFTLKNEGLFMLGTGYYSSGGVDGEVSIRYLDYGGLTTQKVLGGSYIYSQNTAASPDATAGNAVSAPLYYNCYVNRCYTFYDDTNDILYFSEQSTIRYITTPNNTASSTLNTLTTHGSQIENITMPPDKSQLWYTVGTTKLYCIDISSGKSWCDNTTNHFQLASFGGFVFNKGPNQLTWKDNSTLFLSTYNGYILQFDLPTGP